MKCEPNSKQYRMALASHAGLTQQVCFLALNPRFSPCCLWSPWGTGWTQSRERQQRFLSNSPHTKLPLSKTPKTFRGRAGEGQGRGI